MRVVITWEILARVRIQVKRDNRLGPLTARVPARYRFRSASLPKPANPHYSGFVG
jgi:hypothetical protein